MTRTTEPITYGRAAVRLEVDSMRDESDPARHKWFTRLRCGDITGAGPNQRTAASNLVDELIALASCPEAVEALAMVRAREASARAEAARPAPEPEPFEHDADVEVRVGGAEPRWVAGSYDHRDGARFRVWVPEFGGYLTVERSCIRPVNRPSLADVG